MTNAPSHRTAVHRSPHPGIVATVAVLFFVASIVVNNLMTGGAPFPTPHRPIDELQDYYARFADALRLTSFLQFAAVPPLGIFTVAMVSRLLFHRVRVAGVFVALFGGLAAALFLGISALSLWVLSHSGVAADVGAMRTMQLFGFATGGVAHTVTLGLLLAGISVPCLAFRLMPRWLPRLGLILAAIAVTSVVSMLFPAASFLLPLGRFPAYLWLIAAGSSLSGTRETGGAHA